MFCKVTRMAIATSISSLSLSLSLVHPPTHAAVHAVMLSKKHHRSSTVQGEGLSNEDHLQLLHKQAHEYHRNITTFENMPTPSLRSRFKFIAHGCIFEGLW